MTAETLTRPARFWIDLVSLCRPWQWVKNVFVLAPLLFSPAAWGWASVAAALLATACFCLWSGSIYCLNDLIDSRADAQHPRKRLRPVPAGRVSPGAALTLSLLLAVAGVALGSALLPWAFLVCGGLYLGNSLAYCVLLKHRVIVDVMSIAIGFVLRLLGGCAALGLPASSWLLVCGFALAMLLGFGKRRLEVEGLQRATEYRPALIAYDVAKLNMLLGITASVCLVSYMLYTVAPQTLAVHGTDKLVYTVPFVAYGIFRYLFKVQEGRHDGPVEVLFKDPVFALNGLLWILAVAGILHLQAPLAGEK